MTPFVPEYNTILLPPSLQNRSRRLDVVTHFRIPYTVVIYSQQRLTDELQKTTGWQHTTRCSCAAGWSDIALFCYTVLLIRYIFMMSIPKNRQISLLTRCTHGKVFIFKKSQDLIYEYFLFKIFRILPYMYIEEENSKLVVFNIL